MKILVHGDFGKTFFNMGYSIREPYYANMQHELANIDFLRPWYCELTALYYVLNNYNDDVVGIEQYRRYILSDDEKQPITEKEIQEKLKNADVICGYNRYPCKWCGDYIYTWPIKTGKKHYFEAYLEVIKEMYGDKMYEHFNNFLYGQWHCHGNLVIGKRDVLEKYMMFLIETFASLKQKVNIWDNKNQRMLEYLSEFLFGAWLTFYGYKIYWQPWNNCGQVMESRLNK